MNNNEKMMYVTIYADETGLFSESELDFDNLTEMWFPEKIVREWYESDKEGFDEECENEGVEPNFENWIKHAYTADSTDGLYDFAIEKGYTPKFNIEGHFAVFYRDDNNFKTIVFEGTYNECREFGKENDWIWTAENEDHEDEENEDDVFDDDENEYELELLTPWLA